MAEFNPKVDSVGTTNYINYSNRSSGNEGWGTLFEGLVKGADQMVQMGLQKDINATVSQADNDYFGVDAVVAGATGTQPPAPTGNDNEVKPPPPSKESLPNPIQEGTKAIDGLTRGYKAGSISATNYAAQLEAKVRTLKAQYPGYTDVIDTMTSNALNSPTAAMLRNAIESERNAKATSQQKIDDEIYKSLNKYRGAFGPELSVRIANRDLNQAEINELLVIVGDKENFDQQLDTDTKRLGLAKSIREQSQQEREDTNLRATKNATNYVAQHAENMLFGMGAADPKGYKKLVEDIQRMGKDGIDATELAQLAPRIQEVTIAKDRFIQETLYKQGDNGDYFINLLPEGGADKFRKEVDTLYAPITALMGGDPGALSALSLNATLIKAQQESTQRTVLGTPLGQQLTLMDAVRKSAPGIVDKYMSEELAMEDAKGSPVATALRNVVTGKMITEGVPLADMLQMAQQDGNSTSAITGAAKTTIDAGLEVLKDPKATAEAKANTLKSLFNTRSDFLRLLDDRPDKAGKSSQMRTYEQMTAPEILKAMQKLDETQPGALQQYAAWTVSQGNALYKAAQDTGQESLDYSAYAKMTFVPEKNQYDFAVDPTKFKSAADYQEFLAGGRPRAVAGPPGAMGGFVGAKDFSTYNMRQDYANFVRGQRVTRQINSYLVKAIPILEATGMSKEDAAKQLLLSLNPSAEKRDRMIELMNTVTDYAMPDVIYNAGKGAIDAVGGVIEGVQQNITDRNTPIQPEGGSFVDENAPAEGELTVDPDVMPENPDQQGSVLPDGTQIQPASVDLTALPFDEETNNTGPVDLNKVTAKAQETDPEDLSPVGVARQYLGFNEKTHAKVIGSFIKKSAGINIDTKQTAWCAAFVNAVMGATGREGTGKLNARSFLNYGTPTTKPSEGDIVVVKRGTEAWQGHVGLYMGEVTKNGKKYIKILGGNQNDSVSIEEYPANTLLGYRKPPKAGTSLMAATP